MDNFKTRLGLSSLSTNVIFVFHAHSTISIVTVTHTRFPIQSLISPRTAFQVNWISLYQNSSEMAINQISGDVEEISSLISPCTCCYILVISHGLTSAPQIINLSHNITESATRHNANLFLNRVHICTVLRRYLFSEYPGGLRTHFDNYQQRIGYWSQ